MQPNTSPKEHCSCWSNQYFHMICLDGQRGFLCQASRTNMDCHSATAKTLSRPAQHGNHISQGLFQEQMKKLQPMPANHLHASTSSLPRPSRRCFHVLPRRSFHVPPRHSPHVLHVIPSMSCHVNLSMSYTSILPCPSTSFLPCPSMSFLPRPSRQSFHVLQVNPSMPFRTMSFLPCHSFHAGASTLPHLSYRVILRNSSLTFLCQEGSMPAPA